MTYTFKNTLANSEVQVSEKQAEWMASRAYGPLYAYWLIGKLKEGKRDYVAVENGRITKGTAAEGNTWICDVCGHRTDVFMWKCPGCAGVLTGFTKAD